MEKDLSVSSVNVMLDSSTDSLEIDKDPDEIICSKFHFVDLAGSLWSFFRTVVSLADFLSTQQDQNV